MKLPLIATTALALMGASAFAQSSPPPAAPQPAPPAATRPATPDVPRPVNAAPLENGANSFTEGQAADRLREAGITDVTGLSKDDNGIWRGRGQWQGRSVEVGLDYRGNIQAR